MDRNLAQYYTKVGFILLIKKVTSVNKFHKYNAEITRVVDGDTIDAIVDLGFSTSMKLRFRLTGFDAPETYRPKSESERVAGKLATKALIELVAQHDNKVIIHSNKFGKYRYLGTLYHEGDAQSLNDKMIALGHTKQTSNKYY